VGLGTDPAQARAVGRVEAAEHAAEQVQGVNEEQRPEAQAKQW